MRPPAAVAAIFAAAVTCAACLTAAGTAMPATAKAATVLRASAPPASTAACYDFAVDALRQHIVVQRTPAACAGLAAEQVNEAVARAVRTVVGPLPKAAARRQVLADSRYLGSLIRPAAPGPPASAVAAPSTTGSTVPARLAALIVWLTAAAAGTRLLVGKLSRGRRGRTPGTPLWVLGSHAGLATAGLVMWVAFLVTGSTLIGWLDVAMTWLIAGLGMATLLADPPGQYAASASASAASLTLTHGRAPVLTIALHGAFAATTMALVLYAVIGVG